MMAFKLQPSIEPSSYWCSQHCEGTALKAIKLYLGAINTESFVEFTSGNAADRAALARLACCPCPGNVAAPGKSLPLICLVPRDGKSKRADVDKPQPSATSPATSPTQDFPLLDEEYIKKHFKLPPRPLYLDPFRFIWHSCKKSDKKETGRELKRGGGPLNKPKPWLLSRHTDFDLLSQW
ncbi:unnamed protein product, partial [Iphiclides podalirius]